MKSEILRDKEENVNEKVGFIGLGTMGMPMVRNLIKAGFDVKVYNRTKTKVAKMVEEGAKGAASPKEVAAGNSVVVTIVSDTPDVKSLILGENGVIEGLSPGSVVIDMSTISPEAARGIALELKRKDCYFLDAPVSGGEQGAIDGALSIMVGGEATIIERCRPIFEALGKSLIHIGPNGMGQTAKLMNQILVAGNLNAAVEALIFGRKQGMDLVKAIDAIKGGAAGSWQFSNLAPRIISRDFRPGFKVKLMKKDLNLVMQAADSVGAPLPATSLIRQMFYCLDTLSEDDNGTQSLVKALERLAGVEVAS